MSLFIADTNTVVFQFESGTYAEPAGSKYWIGLVNDHTPTDNENIVNLRYTGQSNRNVDKFISTAKDYEGTVTYHPQTFNMFGLALGSNVDAGSPTPYSHVMSEINSDDSYAYISGTNNNMNFPSFTIIDSKKAQKGDGYHQVRTYKGCAINSLSFTAAQGEPVTCELNYIAQNLVLGSKTTDLPTIANEDTSRPYIFSDVQVHLPSGTKINEVNEVGWTLTNNLERRHYDNGSKVIDSLAPLNRDYEINLNLDANTTWGKTLYEQYWQGGSTFNMGIEAVISTGSEQGFFTMSGCKITNFESPSPSEGINEYSVTINPEDCILHTDDLVEKHNPW